ncbi:hypothetical protein JQC92_08815 [Shewanella sp. 202IG2-18]|uniref:hypothetical protein n=1 Tax=Parashewanella hymeniacidonis TaxID=2807618 RepID=UPI0019603ECA|nr:hypothetical protein [Parashewanella hymeniacidonis]MBM7072129.1 hypothetical protein [Parashewanella hymeniacidonis]
MKKVLNAIFCAGLPKKDIQNANKVNLWGLAWAATLCATIFMIESDWFDHMAYVIIALVINAGAGVAMVLAYKRLLANLDEMEKKIQLDALALSVGITIIVYAGGSILEKANIISYLSPAALIASISLSYVVGLISGRVRYL